MGENTSISPNNAVRNTRTVINVLLGCWCMPEKPCTEELGENMPQGQELSQGPSFPLGHGTFRVTGSVFTRADIKAPTELFSHTFGQTSSLRGRMPSAGGLLLTGVWEVSRWWNRETLPNTSWQYRWSSSNSSSISTASRGSLFWISCSPNTMSWSILLVFNVISCWKPYLGYKKRISKKENFSEDSDDVCFWQRGHRKSIKMSLLFLLLHLAP